MNLRAQFRALLPTDPLFVGEVVSHNADGTSTLQAPDGAYLRARGQTVAVGLQAFVRGGLVEGEAPSLPTFAVEV